MPLSCGTEAVFETYYSLSPSVASAASKQIKKGGATLYSSFEAFCNWPHLIDIPQAHNYNVKKKKKKEEETRSSITEMLFYFLQMNEYLMENMSENGREIKFMIHFNSKWQVLIDNFGVYRYVG